MVLTVTPSKRGHVVVPHSYGFSLFFAVAYCTTDNIIQLKLVS
jgi:hypothetical protein